MTADIVATYRIVAKRYMVPSLANPAFRCSLAFRSEGLTVRRNWTWVQLDLAVWASNDLFPLIKKGARMPSLIPDAAAFERRLAGLPIVKHPASHGPDLCFVSRKTYSAACCTAVSDPRTRQWAKTDATRNPACNGHGGPRIIALARHPSI